MKITFVMASGFTLTGGDRVVATYAEGLHKRGHDVLVVSRPRIPVTLSERVRSLLKGQGWLPDKKKYPSHFDHLDVPCRLTNHFGPVGDNDLPDADVVIATWWETAEWVANLSPGKGAKAYFIQHHEVFDYLPKEKVEASYRLPLHKITIAQWLVDLMKTQYEDPHVSLVPNSVDTTQFFAPPRGKQPFPTVGLTYSDIPWKGCDISLAAFSIAAQQIPDLRLVSFGSEQPTPDLPLPADTEFHLSPSQEQLKKIYSECDAWLFGSRIEGYGLPILEAMACRTPVIGTPAGAAPELLSGGAGVLVDLENPVDMARAIVKICQISEDQWKAMSNTAYTKATSYTLEMAIELFESALSTAMERSQSLY
ncbi:MAG: glycosyltransferase family 4 protein [Drouetiella hepatica Uher 2000/2452]|jgi:glycosyltransferase involved in cell wall biosynthesis|uniref:Glycosyltransferase family 4 protein n=1 Tax=Drouetiella hepatica Uher 2000/2452 TaxID=904376 RepID=A0A951QGC1_9CYAN|nr:glycosyltransferase family 4 protein [Drouetiella hepatica Uher 2000/2452]